MFYASVITRIIHITFLIILNLMYYSADLDLSIPHIGTQEWIKSLNLTLDGSWRAWFADAQVSGLVSGLPMLQFYALYTFQKNFEMSKLYLITNLKPAITLSMIFI